MDLGVLNMENLTVEQKFAKAMLCLRKIRPYYSAIYEVMEKKELQGFGTVGVSTDTLYYDPEYVDKIPFNEFLFIILHEVTHIALQHVARRENRDSKLWNIACDLYSNAVLAEEFNMRSPGHTVMVEGYKVKFPEGAVYCSSIDIDEDFVEGIYSKLEEQGRENGYNESDEGLFSFNYTNSNGDNSLDQHGSFSTIVDKSADCKELIDNGEDQNIKNQKSNKIIADASVRIELSSNKIGTEDGRLSVLSKGLLKSELDWKKLLKRYLIKSKSTDSSYANPDKRMYYQKAIYPGQVAEEVNEIKGVKVCIDVSGSISDSDLAYFCGQVYSLTSKYNVQAELIYWDTVVQSAGNFSNYKEFERVDCYGRGGTMPSVVFDYFDSKKCKVKPIVTLMFTDGYFYGEWATPKMKKKYKDCIWVMTRGYNKDFEPPFGKKAIAKFE